MPENVTRLVVTAQDCWDLGFALMHYTGQFLDNPEISGRLVDLTRRVIAAHSQLVGEVGRKIREEVVNDCSSDGP